MLFTLKYAVNLLEKLCDASSIDYSKEKAYWQKQSDLYKVKLDTELAEINEKQNA